MNWLMTPHDKAAGYILAALIHGSLLLWGNKAFYSPPEYGINAKMGSVEVNLVAALPAKEPEIEKIQKPAAPVPKEFPKENILKPKDEMVLPSELKQETVREKPKPSKVHGDGSSSVPGHDAITFHSSAAIQTVASPDFVENMAPPYPERAKELKQEGLVLLLVKVDTAGHPVQVEIKQSSGFFLLDQAAVKAVKHWKFAPGRIGGVAVESAAEVPIRFRLDQST